MWKHFHKEPRLQGRAKNRNNKQHRHFPSRSWVCWAAPAPPLPGCWWCLLGTLCPEPVSKRQGWGYLWSGWHRWVMRLGFKQVSGLHSLFRLPDWGLGDPSWSSLRNRGPFALWPPHCCAFPGVGSPCGNGPVCGSLSQALMILESWVFQGRGGAGEDWEPPVPGCPLSEVTSDAGAQPSRLPGPAFPQAPSEFQPALQAGCLLFLPRAEYLPPPGQCSHRSCCLHRPHPCLCPVNTSLLQNPTRGPAVSGSARGPWLDAARCPHHFLRARDSAPQRGPCGHVRSLVGAGAPGGPKSSSCNNSSSSRSSS